MRVQKSCLRYLVPFSVGLGFEEACAQVDSWSAPVWQRVYSESCQNHKGMDPGSSCESDLYSNVRNEFRWDEQTQPWQNKMGYTWQVQDAGPLLGRLRYVAEPEKLVAGEPYSYIEFDLTQMELMLFCNGLGFVWYEVSIRKNVTAQELQEFQNHFKELNRGIFSCIWQVRKEEPALGLRCQKIVNGPQKHPIPAEYLTPFSMGHWLAKQLSFLQPVFLPDRANAYGSMMKKSLSEAVESMRIGDHKQVALMEGIPARVPDKAVLFTYAAFETSSQPVSVSQEHRQLAYHLTNGYKEAYRYSCDLDQWMTNPFSNVLWYMSREGCGYLAWPDEKNKDFFCGLLAEKIRNDYFTLFIKGMFQSYSLLLFDQKIQNRLSAVTEDYLVSKGNTVREGLMEEMERLICEINVFLAKSMETSVSHIDHQNRFYNEWIQRLRIHDEVRSVTAGLDALEELQREQQKREERQRDERLNFFLNVVAVLGAILTFSNLFELLLEMMPTREGAWAGLAVIAVAVWLVVRHMKKR